MFRTTGCVRIRAKSWTGAVIRLPQPRFVQTWLSALSRLQCGQIGFGNVTTSSVSDRIMPLYRLKRNRREAKCVLLCRASCTGSSTARLVLTGWDLRLSLDGQARARMSRSRSRG
jgi:hypothetical protein